MPLPSTTVRNIWRSKVSFSHGRWISIIACVPLRYLLRTLLSLSDSFLPLLRFKKGDVRETAWWRWQGSNYWPCSVLCLGWCEKAEPDETVWSYCFCRVCCYFLLCESSENSLILVLHFPLRLYSKVTGQNAAPDSCKSPLPISTDHSMLPDITGSKLCSNHPKCGEYPFPALSVFICL